MKKFKSTAPMVKRRSPAAKALASGEFKPKRIAGKKYSRKGLKPALLDTTLGVDETLEEEWDDDDYPD